MKKIYSLVLILISITVFTGCTSKTVICTKTEDNNIKKSYVTFKGNKVTKIVIDSSLEVEKEKQDETLTELDAVIKNIFSDKIGIKAYSIKENNLITLRIEVDPSKVESDILGTDISKESFENTSKEEYINKMETQGYTCTIDNKSIDSSDISKEDETSSSNNKNETIIDALNQAKEGANKRSLEAYAKAMETKYYSEKINGNDISMSSIVLTDDDYVGSEIKCTNKSVGSDVVLVDCTIGGEGTYSYKNGVATKDQ